eukprot:2190898-Pyramimonas_sp.AAC.1
MAAMSSPRWMVCLPGTGPKMVPIARMSRSNNTSPQPILLSLGSPVNLLPEASIPPARHSEKR